MREIPRVKSVMTPFPYSIDLAAPLARAREMMAKHGFHHLPVMKDGALVGVVSDRRAREALETAGGGSEPTVETAAELEPLVVELGARLDSVALEMAARQVDSAVVVKEGRLAGIFTATDACRCLGRYLRAEFPLGGGDEVA